MSPRQVSLDEVAEDVASILRQVNDLPREMAELYVRKDVYDEARRAQDREIRGVKALAMWALGLVCGLALAALVTFITQGGPTP